MYFNKRGNAKKITQEETDSYHIKDKEGNNMIELVDKLTDLVKDCI